MFIYILLFSSQNVAYGKPGILSFNVNGCEDKDAEVDFLEHVQIQITLTYTIRGALEMYLTSPTGKKYYILIFFYCFTIILFLDI